MNDLVSIIVPVYNREKYIMKCLESLMNQTYNNIEIIVVDDGSNDTTPFIISNLSNIDKRIKIISVPNGGGIKC